MIYNFLISIHSQAKLEGEGGTLYQNGGGSNTSAVFNPDSSEISLTIPSSDAPYDAPYQQWDNEGRAVGYAPDPRIYAPQPKKPESLLPGAVGNHTPTTRTAPLPHESTDTVAWELQTNAEQGQSYRLSPIPSEALHNPYDDSTTFQSPTTMYAPLAGPPPSSSVATGEYAFSAPSHSFSGGRGRASPPPPSYVSRQ